MSRAIASTVKIAERVGVSQQTVSRVLGGKAHLHSEETVRKIFDVAESVGYRPNLLAKGLLHGRTQTVGVMVPFRQDTFYAKMVSGCHDALAARGYAPLLMLTSDAVPVEELINRMLDRRMDGILLRPSATDGPHGYVRQITRHHIPVVALNAGLPGYSGIDVVCTDDFEGGALAAQHLLSRGYRDAVYVALIASRTFLDHSPMGLRWQGFRSVFEAAGGRCGKRILADTDIERSDAGRELFRSLLGGTDRPSAVFLGMDPLAWGFYSAASELGLCIPADIGVIGFADLEFTGWMAPPLTTIRQNPEAIGRRAADLLLDRIESKEFMEPQKIALKPELMVRGSTR